MSAQQRVVFESGFTGFPYDEMEVLAVGCYEDGGALPLCDVVRNEKVTFYE